MRSPTPRPLLTLAALAALLGVGLYARAALGLEWNLESIRQLISTLGIWGPIGFVALLTLRVGLLIPSKLLLVVAGICFGALPGTVYGAIGIALSGLVVFTMTRWLGVEHLRRSVPPAARRGLAVLGTRAGAGLMGIATGYPFGPLTLYHAGAALTAMTLPAFAIAVALGGTVRAAAYAYFGSALVAGGPRDIAAASSILVVAALPLLHPRVRSWIRGKLGASGV